MAFQMPSVKDLAQRARTAFRTELPSTDSWLWGTFLTVVSKVFAGIVWSIFGRLKWIDKQRFASTATGENLERYGSERGIKKKTAAFAAGIVEVVGTPSTSSSIVTITAGTTFTRSDGVAFQSSIDVNMSLAGTASIPVIALQTGTNSNTIYGTQLDAGSLSITSAIVGTDGIGGGSSTEQQEELRARILFQMRNPPQGGALTDYIIWATSVAGVTRAFVDNQTNCGSGIVVVYPMLDTDNAANYGLPTSSDLLRVQAYLNSVKPVTARVIVASPTPYIVNVIVKGLTPSNAAIRQAAADEIYNTIYRNAKVTTSAGTNILHRSWLWQAVASVAGQQFFEINSPAADVVMPVGAIPVVGSVSFI